MYITSFASEVRLIRIYLLTGTLSGRLGLVDKNTDTPAARVVRQIVVVDADFQGTGLLSCEAHIRPTLNHLCAQAEYERIL